MKFEQYSHGRERSLIVKSCTKKDFCKYTVKCFGQESSAKLVEVNKEEHDLAKKNCCLLTDLANDYTLDNGIGRFSVLAADIFSAVDWLKGMCFIKLLVILCNI